MAEQFRKDMSHLSWDEVYQRQVNRAPQIAAWLDALALQPGERVLDAGCGPGYVSLRAAELVGPAGAVYAVDRAPEALAYLERLAQEQGLTQVYRFQADAGALPHLDPAPDAALVTMMLHHGDVPEAIVKEVARVVRPGGRILIAEFHPEGPCDHGPDREHRIAPETVQQWCAAAGLTVAAYRRQNPEHYMLLLKRA